MKWKNTCRWSGKASLRRRYQLRSDSRPSRVRGVPIDMAGFRQVKEPALQGQCTYPLRPTLWLRSEIAGTGKALSRCKEEVSWIPVPTRASRSRPRGSPGVWAQLQQLEWYWNVGLLVPRCRRCFQGLLWFTFVLLSVVCSEIWIFI